MQVTDKTSTKNVRVNPTSTRTFLIKNTYLKILKNEKLWSINAHANH